MATLNKDNNMKHIHSIQEKILASKDVRISGGCRSFNKSINPSFTIQSVSSNFASFARDRAMEAKQKELAVKEQFKKTIYYKP